MRVERTSVRYKGIVCPLCRYCISRAMVSFCAPYPCYILSWWKRSRGSCGANGRLSIYMGRLAGRLVLSSRLLRFVFLLVPPSRGSVSLFVLSRAFRLAVLRWRFVSSLRFVSRFAYRLVSSVPSCRVAFVAGGGSCGAWAAWATAMVFSCRYAMLWRWRLVSRVPVGLAGVGR